MSSTKGTVAATLALPSQRGTFGEANDDVLKDASQLAVMGKIKEQLN
jgi:hypothetical protein